MDKVHYWLLELAKELEERVIEDRKANARLPQLLTVNVYSPPAPGQSAMPSQVWRVTRSVHAVWWRTKHGFAGSPYLLQWPCELLAYFGYNAKDSAFLPQLLSDHCQC